MTASIATPPKLQFFDSNGVPLSGGKLYSYAAGTTTPLATYTSSSGGTANTNPIILDSRGEANVWLNGVSYKLKLTSSTDVEIWTVDNLNGADQATLATLAASSGSSLIGYIQGGTSSVATTVQAKLRETISVKDFGATGDGTTNDTTAIQTAVNAANNKQLVFPSGTYLINDTVSNTSISNLDIAGEGYVLIKATANLSGSQMFTLGALGATNEINVSNVNFNGQASTYTSNLELLAVYGTVVRVSDCGFEGYADSGLRNAQDTETQLFIAENCTFDGGNYGVETRGKGSKFLNNNLIKNALSSALYVEGTSQGDAGTTGLGSLVVTNNRAIDCYGGPQIRQGNQGVISNNTVYNPTVRGIVCGDSMGSMTVEGNSILIDKSGLSVLYGIAIDVTETSPTSTTIEAKCVVSGNTIKMQNVGSTLNYGIRFTGISDVVCSNNVISGTDTACIQTADSYCDDYVIANNLFTNYTNRALNLNGSNNNVTSNVFNSGGNIQPFNGGTDLNALNNVFYGLGTVRASGIVDGNIFPNNDGTGLVSAGTPSARKSSPYRTINSSSVTLYGTVEDYINVDTTGGNRNIVLPAISDVGYGQRIVLVKIVAANNMSVTAQGTDIVNTGAASGTTISNILAATTTGYVELFSMVDDTVNTWLVVNKTTAF